MPAITKDYADDFLENAYDLIQIASMNGELLYVNHAWRKNLGYTKKDAGKLTLWDIIHPDSLEHCQRLFAQLPQKGELNNVEAAFRKKNGERLIVQGNVNLRCVDGKPVSTRGIFRNVTTQRQTENSLRLRAQLLDFIDDSITLRDTSGKLFFANKAAYEILGYSKEEFYGLPLENILAPPLRKTLRWRITSILSKDTADYESSHQRKDGSLMAVDVHTRVLGVTDKKVMLNISRDISNRKDAEKIIIEKSQQLEAANKAKTKFVASMSHELRTPLNGIIGLSNLILEGAVGTINQELKGCIEDIITSGQHLLKLINDILDLSKIEAGKFEVVITDMHLADAVNPSMNILKNLIDEKDHEMTVDIPADLPRIKADPDRLEQVLTNLVGNAIKYTPKHGKISLNAHVDGKYCQVVVTDNGIGIKKADLTKVFKAYVQIAKPKTAATQSTGLGLPISRQLVEMMNGVIWAESKYRHGSSFYFALPLTDG
jgi:PAS domain S-box-containing protein